jgi:hypothetical protein
MKAQITITWNGDDTRISYSPSFNQLHEIAKLDCLQDAIADLEDMYEAVRENWRGKLEK